VEQAPGESSHDAKARAQLNFVHFKHFSGECLSLSLPVTSGKNPHSGAMARPSLNSKTKNAEPHRPGVARCRIDKSVFPRSHLAHRFVIGTAGASMTCIGNGPNFMVKSIAESAAAHVPILFGYIFKYSLPFPLPILG
jgi:hypothetical protein